MGGLVRDARRDPSSNDDLAGLEALDYWTHLCDRARRKTDARLFVSNEYLSFRFGCIIEPTGFIMNKHAGTTTPRIPSADQRLITERWRPSVVQRDLSHRSRPTLFTSKLPPFVKVL